MIRAQAATASEPFSLPANTAEIVRRACRFYLPQRRSAKRRPDYPGAVFMSVLMAKASRHRQRLFQAALPLAFIASSANRPVSSAI